MATKEEIQVEDKELQRAIKRLQEKSKTKYLRQAYNKGLRRFRAAAKQKAKKRLGYLRKTLSTKVKTYRDDIWGAVGVDKSKYTAGTYSRGKRKGRPRMILPYKYAHLVHDGFQHRGGSRVTGDRFLEDAFRKTKAEMLQVIHDDLKKKIEGK